MDGQGEGTQFPKIRDSQRGALDAVQERIPNPVGVGSNPGGGGPRVGTVGEGEEVGEILITALAGVMGADIWIFGARVGMLSLSMVGRATVGRRWVSGWREAVLIAGWDCENF